MLDQPNIIRIGLPNQGRLGDICRSIFIDSLHNLERDVMESRKYSHNSIDGKFEFIFARSDDLPKLLAQGVIDLCMTGKDYVIESEEKTLVELLDLDLCAGDISVLVPADSHIKNASDLEGVIVATQLPIIAQDWLETNQINAKLRVNKGANEVYPHLGLAEATIDVVSTGQTAQANGLVPIAFVMHSSGRLWTTENAHSKFRAEISELVKKLRKDYLKNEGTHTSRRNGSAA
ncbi:MAG TPA: ATP phosphoribosyltransferase [Patescibacteria group bacterium]|nr:ATP phosphoribosyltransferase [Patescibacteria group bacterium]